MQGAHRGWEIKVYDLKTPLNRALRADREFSGMIDETHQNCHLTLQIHIFTLGHTGVTVSPDEI
jgi:hypothetical protein